MSAANIKPVFTKNGQVMVEDIRDLILCKPRLIPLKSYTLEKLEKMQQDAQKCQAEGAKTE